MLLIILVVYFGCYFRFQFGYVQQWTIGRAIHFRDEGSISYLFLSFLAKNGFLRLFNGKQHLKGATILMLGLQCVKIISKRLAETIRRSYIL